MARGGGAVSPKDPPVCLPYPVWRSQVNAAMSGFYMGAEALNSDPDACAESMLTDSHLPSPSEALFE